MARDPEQITYFAATDYRGKRVPFGIKRKDRDKHMYVIGKTGMGKSTMLENMAIQDIQNGEGMAFLDPHGTAADKLLEYVPESRIDDVLHFAPFDMEYPVAFNIMEDVGYDKRHLVVASLMSTFKKIWVDVWSSRMEYILENVLFALLEYPDSTLLDVNRMLVNKDYRKKVVDNVKDPVVKSFWTEEFATYTDRYTQEATPAIQNKIGQLASNPLIRNVIGQPNSSFDVRRLMDEGKIIIANISKGRMGEKNAKLLGSMLTIKLYLSAMSRAEESSAALAKLPDFYLYVDEFQSIANETFADILAEARKYKLNLIIAHQYITQMEEEVRDAVFGNVGTTVTFRVGPLDAEVLEVLYKPTFVGEDIVNLGKYQIYLTLMIDGVGSPPFSAVTLPSIEPPRRSFKEEVIENSRKIFANDREKVENDIRERGFTEDQLVTNPDQHRNPEEKKRQQERKEAQERREARKQPARTEDKSKDKPKEQNESKNRSQNNQSQHKNRPPRREKREAPPAPPLEEGAVPLAELGKHAKEHKPSENGTVDEPGPASPQERSELRDALASVLKESRTKNPPAKEQKEEKEESAPAKQSSDTTPKSTANTSSGNGEVDAETLKHVLRDEKPEK